MEKKPNVGVGVLITNKSGEVLMGLRKGSHGAGEWSLPGGGVEFGETVAQTARREVAEETGITIDELNVICVFDERNYVTSDGKHFVGIGFESTKPCLTEPQLKEPEKCIEWKWFDIHNIPNNVLEGTRLMIEAKLSGTIYKEIV